MNFKVECNSNSPASLAEGGEGVRGREEDTASAAKMTFRNRKQQVLHPLAGEDACAPGHHPSPTPPFRRGGGVKNYLRL